MKNVHRINQHIYITSDEKIKERDYFISKEGTIHDEFGGGFGDKKVILTTDQDLIDNGVQAITNTFAEWFVKNPSCEVIQVENEMVASKPSSIERWDYKYKIILPQEEAKQETLEEAAEKFTENLYYKVNTVDEFNGEPLAVYNAFIEGAKWQEEKIPSIIEEYLETAFISKEQGYMNPKDWFEQFKKK